MTSKNVLRTLLATGSILLAGASAPAVAASAASEAFVANVRPNVDYLDKSSRMALDKSNSPRIRGFAHSEAKDETITANSLVAWTQTHTRAGEAVALGVQPMPQEPLMPMADLAIAPLAVAGNVTNGVGDVLTGRSVAIDNPLVPLTVRRTPDTAGDASLPANRDDLARLSSLTGRQFNALYLSTQSDALHQLATLYRDYMGQGDDPALQAMATRELPKINARIAELRRL